MGMLKFAVPHSLSKEDARARVQALLDHWTQKHGIRQSWLGDDATLAGKVMGIALEATLRVVDGSVEGEASDPGLLLRSQARKYLEEKFRAYLDPAKSLSDLKRVV